MSISPTALFTLNTTTTYTPDETEEYTNPDTIDGDSPRSVPRHCRYEHEVSGGAVYWYDAREGTNCHKYLEETFSRQNPQSPYRIPFSTEDRIKWVRSKASAENPLLGIYCLASVLCKFKDDEQKCLEALDHFKTVILSYKNLSKNGESLGEIIDDCDLTYEEKGAKLCWLLHEVEAIDIKRLQPEMKMALSKLPQVTVQAKAVGNVWNRLLKATGFDLFF